jgi:predicted amidophosphoribosyltransferase
MVCKGICIRHKAMKPVATGRYSIGQKRCQVCEIFLKWDGLWCPCCGYRLRTNPRNSKFKAELRARKEIDKAKISVVYKQPPTQAPEKHIAQSYTSSHLSKLIKSILHTKGVSRLQLKNVYYL